MGLPAWVRFYLSDFLDLGQAGFGWVNSRWSSASASLAAISRSLSGEGRAVPQ
jgi:hypothetical protein